jgi:membrane protein YqaA with SNARE-associated domain
VTSYGVGGMLLVSSLPIILHPVIVFGILSGLSDPAILSIVFAGRTLKYLVMSYITVHAPSALRFFGIKTDLVEYATKAIRGDAAK